MKWKQTLSLLYFIQAEHLLTANLCFVDNIRAETFNEKPDSYFQVSSSVVSDFASCASKCGLEWRCTSFFYSSTTQTCLVYRSRMPSLNMGPDPGWTGYHIQGRPLPEAYSKCQAAGYTPDPESHMCYKIHVTMVKWTQAQDVCHSEGGELVSLNTGAKTAVVEAIVVADGSNEYFLGATNHHQDGKWRWLMDDSLVSHYTASGDPECLELETGNIYDGTGCDDQLQKYICEIYM